jgi:hypothetical protein
MIRSDPSPSRVMNNCQPCLCTYMLELHSWCARACKAIYKRLPRPSETFMSPLVWYLRTYVSRYLYRRGESMIHRFRILRYKYSMPYISTNFCPGNLVGPPNFQGKSSCDIWFICKAASPFAELITSQNTSSCRIHSCNDWLSHT